MSNRHGMKAHPEMSHKEAQGNDRRVYRGPWLRVTHNGTETTSGNYKVVTFNASGYFEVDSLGSDSTNGALVEYIVVAGGGGGGQTGGGGAGGHLPNTGSLGQLPVTKGRRYNVAVGAGGAAGNGSAPAASGSDSYIDHLTAIGGGGTDCYSAPSGINSKAGGCGAGASGNAGSIERYGGGGRSGQGYLGGASGIAAIGGGGGGGGAAGGAAAGSAAGAGGGGVSTSITGVAVTRAGGGGGGNGSGGGTAGAGGSGGGGAGVLGGSPGAGTANTGGGGGGGGSVGAAGGSGVVIIRWRFQ